MVPMNPQEFKTVDYAYNQLLQAISRMNEVEVLLKRVGKTASAAKVGSASRAIREEADHLYQQLATNGE